MEENNQVVTPEDLEKINQHTLSELSADDVYIFKVQLCDNDIDRVGDKMSDAFLKQVAERVKGVTGLKDHDWNVDNQLARLYDAEVVVDTENKTRTGEQRKYVLGKAYTLSKNKDLIDKINAGLLKETSISFKSNHDTCSICGEPMIKDESDTGHCKNNHVANHIYDNKPCFNLINDLEDILEWSLVAVPCQRRAGINSKGITDEGGMTLMKKAEMLIRKFMNSKSYEQADPEDKAALESVMESDKSVDLSDDDIKDLIAENSKLKAKIADLEGRVKAAEDGRNKDKIEHMVSKSIDDLKPLTPKVKDMMLKDIPWDTLKLEDGQIPGMDDVFAGIKESYKGLYSCEDTVDNTVSKEVENEQDKQEEGSDKNEEDTNNKEDVQEVENKELVTPEVVNKELKGSGITFGVSINSNNKSVNNPNRKPGIYFN